jgi:Na+:H+ antiporter, NhaA family
MKNSDSKAAPADALAGLVLLVATVAALILANSPLAGAYGKFLGFPLRAALGPIEVAKPLLLWVNDGLMAIFFFLVGLEIKREMLEGELSSTSRMLLPVLAAVGGMAVPAAIYASLNWNDAIAIRGWAIPAATDIAFAIAAVAMLGSRVPASLRIFLTAVAIVDDLGAVIIIALFYTADLSAPMLAGAAVALAILVALNRFGVMALWAYALVGAALWFCVLKSGVHATLAGVATALCVPLRASASQPSPLRKAEHALHGVVNVGVVPIFAFANAGVALAGVSLATLLQPIPMGIVAGLVAGKAIGVFGASALALKLTGAGLPTGSTWSQLFGVCVLCGIGFTMSLFIGSLAFEGHPDSYLTQVKLGVIGGSVLAVVLGAGWLVMVRKS